MKYLCIDPGGATGWAMFDDRCFPQGHGIERGVDNFAQWISECEPCEVIIYEDFRLFGHKAIAQVGSHMEASQVIGILKLKAKEWGAKLIPQSPQCHKLGELWSKRKEGAHKDSHDIVAYNHGWYYFTKHGLVISRLTKKNITNAIPDI